MAQAQSQQVKIRRKAGAPLKLTPEMQERMARCLRGGAYFATAARVCGLEPQLVYNWMNKGKERPDGVYGQFREAMLEAEAGCETHLVEIVADAAETDVNQAKWLLERRFNERWARPEVRRMDAPVDNRGATIINVRVEQIAATASVKALARVAGMVDQLEGREVIDADFEASDGDGSASEEGARETTQDPTLGAGGEEGTGETT